MVNIRPEQTSDCVIIHALIAAAFPTEAEANLVDALRRGEKLTASLVAVDNGEIVGHIAFSPVQLAGETSRGVGLAPLAVAASHRKQGIAADLVQAGLNVCREMGYRWCVVLGEPSYYRRFGFSAGPAAGLRDEYGGGDAFQVLPLHPDGIPKISGTVRYAEQFNALP